MLDDMLPNEVDYPNSDQTITLQLLPGKHRTRKESIQAYEAFQIYCAVKDESLGGTMEVARRLGKSKTIITRWSSKYHWVERYRQHQNETQLTIQREQQRAIRKRAEDWSERRINVRDTGFKAGEQLVNVAQELLSLPIKERKVKEVLFITPDMVGKTIEIVTEYNYQLHPRDARLFAESGVKLMRLSTDMSTENIAALPSDIDFDNMTDEQLDKYATDMMEMRQKTIEAGNVPNAP